MSSDQRLPANYRVVLDVVNAIGPGSHATAQEIYIRARARQARIGFATVHRSLARLSELGYVLKLDIPGAPSAIYEPATAPHAHFRCTACGAIADLDFALPQATRETIAAQHGMRIDHEAVTFAGTCRDCSCV
jgi:Fe2+ or Zn2+ uptake regulation protein